jgi:hypothetical protein
LVSCRASRLSMVFRRGEGEKGRGGDDLMIFDPRSKYTI